jgi:tetratricopeptide (TPR) repeat protein
MAAKVNTKFVVVLSAISLVVIGGLTWATISLLKNSGADLARMGDKKMAEQQYKEAAEIYAKAVNKEKTNTEFLRKWITALEKTTPETPRAYADAFTRSLVPATRQLALVADEAAAQRDYITIRRELAEAGPYFRQNYDDVIADADLLLQKHTTPSADSAAIRAVRGHARLRIAVNTADAPKELVDGAKEDFEVALTADPKDEDAANGLANWYAMMAGRAAQANDLETARAHMASSEKVIADLLAANPSSVLGAVVSIRQEMDAMVREVAMRSDRPAMTELRQMHDQFSARAMPRLDAAAELAKANPQRVTDRTISLFKSLEQSVDPAAGWSRSESIIRELLSTRPTDANLLIALADIAENRREYPQAIETLQRVLDLPSPSLSLEGQLLFSRKSEAMFRQTQVLYRTLTTLPADKVSEREAIVAQMKTIRDKMATEQDADASPAMLLTDARLAMIARDLARADRLLEQFNRNVQNSVVDGLVLAAEVAMARNEPGSAREHLERVLRLQNTNVGAIVQLAQIEQGLRNNNRALELYKVAQQLQPGNTSIGEQVALIEALMKGGKVSDPVLQVIVDADSMIRDATAKNEAESPETNRRIVAFIRTEIDRLRSTDPRLYRVLALAHIRANDTPGAIAAVEEGLRHNPDNMELKGFRIGISQKDPMTARLELVDLRAAGDGVERHIGRFTVFSDFGRKTEAIAELAEAVRLAPGDKRVIELQFLQALSDKNWTAAEELALRGQKEDVDSAGGDTLRARLEAAKGNGAEGVRIMEAAVARGGAQPESWRLLGIMQNSIGRQTEAVSSFREALRLRPNDVPTINDLVGTLISANRPEEALTVSRTSEPHANTDPTFMNTWMNLEAALGNREMVVQRRSNLFRVNPDDRENALALAALHMDAKKFAEARPILDTVRAKQDGLDAVALDAGWHWAQRDPAKAKQAFEGYIASLSEPAKAADPLMAYAQFLLQRQDVEGAIAALERARPVQDPATARADRALSDTYFSLGRFEDAIQACQRVLAAKADTPDQLFRKRIAECHLNLGRTDEANAILDPMLASPAVDATTMLIAAEARKLKKDERGRREMLDRAVQRFPSDATVFMRRGQAMVESSQDPVVLRDAIADFSKALQLNPALWQALRFRALAHEQLKDSEKAIADLRQALEVNPYDNELLGGLIAYMLRENRDADAFEVANRTLEKRSRDAAAHIGVSQIFSNAGRWDQAIRYMERAYTIDPQDGVAQRYLDALLSAKPMPALTQAERVLDQIKERVPGNPGLLMAQARLRMAQRREVDALRSARDALALLRVDDPRLMVGWFTEARRLVPAGPALSRFLQDLSDAGVATEWLAFFRSAMLLEDVGTQSQGIEVLKEILAKSQNKPLRQLTYRALTGALYNSVRYDEAAAGMQTALNEFPDDYEIMNNLAYTLAKRLNRAGEAMPLAQQVAKAKPTAEVIDTLAVCLLAAGKPEEASAELARAAALDMNPSTAVSIAMHQAEAFHAQNKPEEAQAAIANARKIAENNPSAVSNQLKADLEEVSKRLGLP